VRDEEGGLMNDFTGRVRLEDRKPPKGEAPPTHCPRHDISKHNTGLHMQCM